MTLTVTSSCGSLAISSSKRLERAGDVGLEHEVELLDLGRAVAWSKIVLERDLAARAAGERLGLEARARARRRAGARGGRSRRRGRTRRPRGRRRSRAPRPGRRACASLTRLPMKSCIARTRPQWAPATSASPTCSVPRWIRTVTTGPRPGSSLDSTTTPEASASRVGLELLELGDARGSSRAGRRGPAFVFAETSTNSSRRPTPRAGGRAGSSRCARGRAGRPPCRSC